MPSQERTADGFDPQAVIHDFHQALTGERAPVYDMLMQVYQEGHEMMREVEGMTPEEINNLPPEKKRALVKEGGDVIIAALGLFDAAEMQFEPVFWSTVSVMIEKYPPDVIQRLMSEDNLCRADAMAKQKTLYESRTR